jgi:N-acetylglucosaminyldiphosphoundecaprenol N-acetyl-beta-D-mannosaminyltransferase
MSDIRKYIAMLPFVNTNQPLAVARQILDEWQASDNGKIVHYMYYASYVLMHQEEEVLKDYLTADYILADGIGMQLYFKMAAGVKIANLNGTDMSPIFFDLLVDKNVPICLYGTTRENIEACEVQLQKRFKKDVVAYLHDGYSELNLDNVPENSALFIGMGSPRQECWVRKHHDIIRSKNLLVFTVGGYFDFLSGFYIRAPRWIRKIKMEWAWRTMLHPGRHYKKRLRDISIIFRPLWHRIKGYKKFLKLRWI